MNATGTEGGKPGRREAAAGPIRAALGCLGFRLVLVLTASLILLLGVSGWLAVTLHRRHLETLAQETAVGIGDVVLSSLHASMLENDRDRLARTVENIGGREYVLAVRLLDADGLIRYSDRPAEIGQPGSPEGPSCRGCHAADADRLGRAVRGDLRFCPPTRGRHVMGLGVPVLNGPECANASCHVHPADQTVLGMLNLEISTERVEADLADTRRQLLLLAFITVAVTSSTLGVLTWRVVHRPMHRLLHGIRRLAGGDLGYRIDSVPSGELGELAVSINDMSARLQAARQELQTWGETLEDRVREKTRELERARDQMIFAEKMASLGKLAAVVAHEINNPLAGILVYAKLVRRRLLEPRGPDDPAQLAETMSTIETETARCGDIVRNLLLFSRKRESIRRPEDINEIVERTLKLVRHQADLGEVQLQLELQRPLPPVVCDASEIQQSLLAVVMNALEAMPGGGTLSLRTRSDGGRIVLVIEDTGVGIPPELRDRIYEPFFSTKTEGKGTGLGLSVLYGIVHAHGGTIDVNSEVGRGTRFTIHLPLVPGPAPAGKPVDEAPQVFQPLFRQGAAS